MGVNLVNTLIRNQSSCRKCGTVFTFGEGVDCAMENGINDQVVMCKKCYSVYDVNVTPRGMTLLADVTDKYKKDTKCHKCETIFTYEEGIDCAMENGIDDQVVMCKKCYSVYEVKVIPRGMTLLADVTDKYKKKWWQFWR